MEKTPDSESSEKKSRKRKQLFKKIAHAPPNALRFLYKRLEFLVSLPPKIIDILVTKRIDEQRKGTGERVKDIFRKEALDISEQASDIIGEKNIDEHRTETNAKVKELLKKDLLKKKKK